MSTPCTKLHHSAKSKYCTVHKGLVKTHMVFKMTFMTDVKVYGKWPSVSLLLYTQAI